MSIKAMKQAIEAWDACGRYPDSTSDIEHLDVAINALRTAIQQAEAQQPTTPEPVARVELMQTGGNAGLATRIVEIDDPLRERLRPGDVLYTHPSPGVPEFSRTAIQQASTAESGPVARAWAEGYRQGIEDERISEANIGIAGFGAKVNPNRENPYANSHPAPGVPDDSKRLDYLQDRGATIDLIPGVAGFYPMRFRVGGLHSSANIDVRAAIDAAMLAAKDASA